MIQDKILERIRSGKRNTFFFDDIKLRTLSTHEFDLAKYKVNNRLDPKLAGLILKIRLGYFEGKKLNIDEIDPELYRNYFRYVIEIDYWIVYYSMKDFRDDSFCIDDVYKMTNVHDIAKKVIQNSSTEKEVMKYVVRTPEGRELAEMVWKFNISLTDDAFSITPLQHEFIIESDPNKKIEIEDWEEMDKVLPMLGKMTNEFKHY